MFVLPDLPYPYEALEPTVSAKTLHFHHDKHHAAYVKTLNSLLEQAQRTPGRLEEVIAGGGPDNEGGAKLFNNAAQGWNHAFFWECMTPGATQPGGRLNEAIAEAFGGREKLAEAFVSAGEGHFGSGWVWLVADEAGKLGVRSTHDAHDMAEQPRLVPLLVCDVWEHAYYLDYQNDRKGYLTAWFNDLANWDFAARQYEAARAGGGLWAYPAPIGGPAAH